MTTSKESRDGRPANRGIWPQCSLATARNLLRRSEIMEEYLATRQIGHIGIIDRTDQPNGEIRFLDWAAVLRDIKTTNEVTVHFKPVLEIPHTRTSQPSL